MKRFVWILEHIEEGGAGHVILSVWASCDAGVPAFLDALKQMHMAGRYVQAGSDGSVTVVRGCDTLRLVPHEVQEAA